jgi:hypothetical protein
LNPGALVAVGIIYIGFFPLIVVCVRHVPRGDRSHGVFLAVLKLLTAKTARLRLSEGDRRAGADRGSDPVGGHRGFLVISRCLSCSRLRLSPAVRSGERPAGVERFRGRHGVSAAARPALVQSVQRNSGDDGGLFSPAAHGPRSISNSSSPSATIWLGFRTW